MKVNDLNNVNENTNLHLTHLEDLALFQGKAGALKAVEFLRNLSQVAKSSSPKKFNLTIKWDGSPAIFCGTDPSDGKFFVGTKGVFNKDPKLNKSRDDIINNHPDTIKNGEEVSKAGLRNKLLIAFTHLSKLGIENVLQGDLMFTQGDLKPVNYKGQPYISFKPNTITYAVPQHNELAEKMQRAKIGIVFHTSYSGSNLESMTASFDVDIAGLNKTDDVWYDDAYIKDYTGIVNLTAGEYKAVTNAINDAEKYINSAGNIFDWLEAKEVGKNFKELVHANHNNMIRAGEITQDPKQFFNNFAVDYEKRVEQAIAKLKTGREGSAGQRRLADLEQWKLYWQSNKSQIESWYSAWLKLTAIKNTLYQKLKNIKQIDAFDQEGDEYVVRDQEGFVAVDRIGSAIKVVDRLDFSRKNFAKEEYELSLVNDLTESRAFRSRQDIGKFTAPQVSELVYAYCVALLILSEEYKYKNIAQVYARRTLSYNNFDYFRTNGTDLYLLVHSLIGSGSIIQFDQEKSSKTFIDRLQSNDILIKEFLYYIAGGMIKPDLSVRIMLKLERQLRVTSGELKKLRRWAVDFPYMKTKDKNNAVHSTMHFIQAYAPKSELHQALRDMGRERALKDKIRPQQKIRKSVAKGALVK